METTISEKPQVNTQSGIVERLVPVTLDEADYSAIHSTKQDISRVASYLLESYAQGGVMIPPQRVRELSNITNSQVTSASDVVDIVENCINKKTPDGTLRVTYDVDPAFTEPLEQLAMASGRTIDEIVRESMTIVLTNSWLYSLEIKGLTILLPDELRQRLELVMGRDGIDGTAVVEWAESMASRGVQRQSKKVVQVGEK